MAAMRVTVLRNEAAHHRKVAFQCSIKHATSDLDLRRQKERDEIDPADWKGCFWFRNVKDCQHIAAEFIDVAMIGILYPDQERRPR